MKKASEVYKNYAYFIHAIRYKIKHGSKGGKKIKQKEVSLAIGCTPEHLSGILSPKQTRKASFGLQERVAGYFKMTLIDFLELGRDLYEGTTPKEADTDSPGATPDTGQKRRRGDSDVVAQVSGVVNELHEAYDEINRLNAVMENIGEAITTIDISGSVTYQNRASRELWGGKFIGRDYMSVIQKDLRPPEDYVLVTQRCMDSGMTERGLITINDKTISITASPLLNSAGEVESIINLARDITVRQRLLDENQALVYQLEEAVDMLERGVLIYDEQRRVIYANDKYKEYTGMTDEKTVDEIGRLQESRGVNNLEEIRASMLKAFNEQTETSIVCYSEGGRKTIYSAKPLRNHDGTFIGMLAVISPFTQGEE